MQKRRKQNDTYKMLLLAFGILIVALVVVLILLLAGVGTTAEQREANLVENGHFINGVSIEGVDLSGQTMEQALANETLQSKAQQLEAGFSYAFTAGSNQYNYGAAELGITSSLQQTLEDAMKYGQLADDGETLREQQMQAKQSGYDFKLGMHADEAVVLEKVTALKPSLDKLPQDATLNIRDDVQGEGRFEYIDAVTGVDIDAAAFAKLLCEKINSGDYGAVEAPAIITNPKIGLEALKANTKQISSYSSEFKGSGLDNADRVTNIRILAGIVNGTVIEPGETWSINDAAGPRDEETAKTVGWAFAPGIADGNYRMEVGGGVCQVSSTLYNAAIRAELTIVDRRPHSWPSNYIPKGLDATISTGGPDLKLSNPYGMPIYLETVLDEENKTLTVNIYGPPLTLGYTIEFENVLVATALAPETIYHYNATATPDGEPIDAGKEIAVKLKHDGQTWDVYKLYKDADGNVVKREQFTHNVYKVVQGEIYANKPDPEAPPTESPAQ